MANKKARSKRLRAFAVGAERGRLKRQRARVVSKRTFRALTVRPSAVRRLRKSVRAVGSRSVRVARSPRTRKGVSKIFRTAKGVSRELFTTKRPFSTVRRITRRR